MGRRFCWWVLLLWYSLATNVGAEPVQLAHRWPQTERRYLGEFTGQGTMPVPLLTEEGEWRRVPFHLRGEIAFELQVVERGDRQTTLELRPDQPRLWFTWSEEEQELPVKLPALRLAVTPTGHLRSVLPVDPQAEAALPPTLFDLPLDYFSLFYPLLLPDLPTEPVEVDARWQEEGALPVAGETTGKMKASHRLAGWETRGKRSCVRLESDWETPSLRQRFQIGGQVFFLRTRWQGKSQVWFDPQEGATREADAPVQADLAVQFVLPDGTLFDGEASFSLQYHLRPPEDPASNITRPVADSASPTPLLPPPEAP